MAKWLTATALCVGATLVLAPSAAATFPGKNGKIVFTHGSRGEAPSVHTMRPDGSHERRLAKNAHNPAFSASGKRIAFDRRGDIYVMRANGSHKKRLTRNAARDYSPTFSPGGKRVVFARFVIGKRNDLYTIRTDGTHLKRLTQLDFIGISVFGPQFSPNGGSIVFSQGYPPSIVIIRSDGSHRRVLTDAPGQGFDLWPDFSPNGLRIVFQRTPAGRPNIGAIHVMRRNGTQVTSIEDTAPNNQPAFSPSGKRIVFASKRPPGSRWTLFTMKSDGSGLVGPLTRGISHAPTWGVRP
jgi:TolB protein